MTASGKTQGCNHTCFLKAGTVLIRSAHPIHRSHPAVFNLRTKCTFEDCNEVFVWKYIVSYGSRKTSMGVSIVGKLQCNVRCDIYPTLPAESGLSQPVEHQTVGKQSSTRPQLMVLVSKQYQVYILPSSTKCLLSPLSRREPAGCQAIVWFCCFPAPASVESLIPCLLPKPCCQLARDVPERG